MKKEIITKEKVYKAVRYLGEGSPSSQYDDDGEVIATGSIEDCREVIARKIGVPMDLLHEYMWDGGDWDVTEAYHEYLEDHPYADGCGGWTIYQEEEMTCHTKG